MADRTITLQLSEELLSKLDEAADKADRSRSAQIRQYIEEGVSPWWSPRPGWTRVEMKMSPEHVQNLLDTVRTFMPQPGSTKSQDSALD